MLVVRFTKSFVNASKVSITETVRKRNKTESMVGKVQREIKERNVITMYVKTCASLPAASFAMGMALSSEVGG